MEIVGERMKHNSLGDSSALLTQFATEKIRKHSQRISEAIQANPQSNLHRCQ